MHQQAPAQQRAAMKLVATGLSLAGYVTVATTMGLENVLDRMEGFVARFDRNGAGTRGCTTCESLACQVAMSRGAARFGGHHVSLNNLIVGGVLVSTTPCFMGADPASSPLLGDVLNRPLGRLEDMARELVRSLPPELSHRAVLLDKGPSILSPPIARPSMTATKSSHSSVSGETKSSPIRRSRPNCRLSATSSMPTPA